MKLGEKLYQLRKSKGMSQEQLAAQIKVSRQAISKWELCESIPDTDNIIQLSNLFGVSTDYLLKDELNNISENPSNTTGYGDLTKHSYVRIVPGIFIGIEMAALLLAFMIFILWNPYKNNVYMTLHENVIKAGACFMVQLASVVLFELLIHGKLSEEKREYVKAYFYIASIWLLMPLPMIYLGFIMFPIIRRPITYWSDLLYLLIPYVLISVLVTLCLIIKRSKLNRTL